MFGVTAPSSFAFRPSMASRRAVGHRERGSRASHYRQPISLGIEDTELQTPEPGAADDRARALAYFVTIIALLPYGTVVVTRFAREFLPVQDLAVIALRARDVFSPHPPLTGSWSRIGFAHPGPLFTWLMGVPSALTGGAPWSLIIGAAALHAIAIIVAARLAWARGHLPLVVLVVAGMGFVGLALPAWGLIAPWNIDVALFFFPVFLLLVWSVALGEYHRLPWLAVVTTLLVQSHVGYAPVVALPLLWMAGHLVLDRRSDPEQRRTQRRPLAWSGLWLTLLWLPVLIDQLFVTGNLGATWQSLSDLRSDPAGPATALGWFANEFRWIPRWAGAPDRSVALSGWALPASLLWLAIPAGLLVGSALAVRHRGSRSTQYLVTLISLTTVGGVFAMSRITGDQFAYLFEWRTVIAVFIVATAGVAAMPWIVRRRRIAGVVAACAIGVILISNTALTRRVLTFPRRLDAVEPIAAQLVTAARDSAPHRPFVIRAVGGQGVGITSTLVNELDRRGVPVRTDPWLDFEYGPQRSARAADSARIWIVTESGWLGARLRSVAGGRVIAASHPLEPADEGELARLQRDMWTQLRRAGASDRIPNLDSPLFGLVVADVDGIDHGKADRITTLNDRAKRHGECRCLVVAFPTDRATLRRIHRFENPPSAQSGRSGPAAR